MDEHERGWIIVEGASGTFVASLNNQQIGDSTRGETSNEFEVTSFLRDRNELWLEFEKSGRGQLWQDVYLEIRASAWLGRLSAHRVGDSLEVVGTVFGADQGNLDLYVILGRYPVIHNTVRAAPGGKSFRFASSPLSVAEWPDRAVVELCHQSAIWHHEEVVLTGN
jgi:hypothetical protein